MPTVHNLLGPSKAHRWTVCPGSVREEQKYPDASNESAIDGTHTHTLLESCVAGGLSSAAGFIGFELEDHEGKFTVDKDRADRVQVALDYIEERRKIYGPDTTIAGEQQVDPTWLIGRPGLGGTSDVTIEGRMVRMLEVTDYKDGMVPVPAEDNPQLELYALGKLAELKIPVDEPYPYDLVRMTIIQPKLAVKGLHPVSGREMPVKHLLSRAAYYAKAAAATDAPDAPLVPGESQCRYCRAKGGCSALAAQTMGSIGVMFKSIPILDVKPNPAATGADNLFIGAGPSVPMLDVAQDVANKEPTTLSDDKIREIMEAAPLLRRFIEAVEEEALRRLKSGNAILGLKLVYGRGSRVWSLPDDIIAKKLIGMGIPKSHVYETKVLSVAKAEKVTWVKRDGTAKQLSERQLKVLENEYVSKMTGKLTVVSVADPRPAVELNAAPLFNAIGVSPTDLPEWMR